MARAIDRALDEQRREQRLDAQHAVQPQSGLRDRVVLGIGSVDDDQDVFDIQTDLTELFDRLQLRASPLVITSSTTSAVSPKANSPSTAFLVP